MNLEYEIEEFSLEVFGKNEETKFALKPISTNTSSLTDTTKKKVYLVIDTDNNHFLYVGEARTSMKKRFQQSFGSYRYFKRYDRKRGGYGGYKWIGQGLGEHPKVVVIQFTDSNIDRKMVEAVESELVYLIRNTTQDWPLYQNEIHFYSSKEDCTVGSKELALGIWSKIR